MRAREKARQPPTVGGGFANQSPGVCVCPLRQPTSISRPTSSYTMDPRDCIHGRRFNAPCWAKHTKSLWSTPTRLTTNVSVRTHTRTHSHKLYYTSLHTIISYHLYFFFFIINIILYIIVYTHAEDPTCRLLYVIVIIYMNIF